MIGSLLAIVALGLAVPAVVLWLQVRLAAGARPRVCAGGPRPALVVMVPAHDEAAGIGATLQLLRSQMKPDDRLLVVADNCSDDTAARAVAAGAEVVQRDDPARRGKGYALAAGMANLATQAPPVTLILDADCRPAAGALDILARTCAALDRPVQAQYRMWTPAGAGLGARFGGFAWAVRNQLRPAGAARAGFPCPLFGSGMAFPTRLLASMPLASGHLVEDLKLGVDLMLAGYPVAFCAEACVDSDFPTDAGALRRQRTRWEHGHLSLLLHATPRLLAAALRQRRLAPLAMALDLTVPPLALLSMLQALAVLGGLAVGMSGLGWMTTAVALCGLGLLAAAITDAWRQAGREWLRAGELLRAPLYALRKWRIYARWLGGRHEGWVRTDRAASVAATTQTAERSVSR